MSANRVSEKERERKEQVRERERERSQGAERAKGEARREDREAGGEG